MSAQAAVSPAGHERARVVLFCGGRGAGVLSRELIRDPRVQLTLAINGYDDGASTGEVRRFLEDSLGPSDYRKNGTRLARELQSCPAGLLDLLDARLPLHLSQDGALTELRRRAAPFADAARAIESFAQALAASGRTFNFDDCGIGNIVFAGLFLENARDFNRAIDAFCALVGLPAGLLENVTDGTDAHLVALCSDGVVLPDEETIVTSGRPGFIKDFYLIDPPLSDKERSMLAASPEEQIVTFLERRTANIRLNPRLAEPLAHADLIVYAPGTQYSSLFPSYVTPGLGSVIAGNTRAVKLLITNIQADVEIAGRSAVDIVDRALHYLQEKGTRRWPTPSLITHYLMNDPKTASASTPYVPLGQVDALEDPRLVRIANFEEGVSGRHDAAKVLTPYIRSLLGRRGTQKVAVFLYDAESPTKTAQSILELVRGGLGALPIAVTVFCEGEPLDASFTALLPFPVRALGSPAAGGGEAQLRRIAMDEEFDYLLLFESSGMYRGEDVAGLASHLASGRLDAVWGSRRLSMRDIEESYRFRFRGHPLLGAFSRAGSQMLSLACLGLFGRYLSDTLSGVRAVRAEDAIAAGVPLTNRLINHHLLAHLLRRKADILEVPVQFVPLSPDRVRRTTVSDGLKALGIFASGRLRDRTPSRTTGDRSDVFANERRGEAGLQ